MSIARPERGPGRQVNVSRRVGVGLSNGLVAVSGAFLAQYQGFADVQMGIGMIVVVPDHAVLDVMQRIEAMNERGYVIGEILDCREAGKRLIWE